MTTSQVDLCFYQVTPTSYDECHHINTNSNVDSDQKNIKLQKILIMITSTKLANRMMRELVTLRNALL